MTQPLLYGIHDRQGAHILPPGGWCVDTISLADNAAPTDYTALRGDIQWLVRVNWGYGSTGTIPLPKDDALYLDRLAHYAHNSRGVYAWIIGNEPNHEQERPDGVYITPDRYARFFARARNHIKAVDPSAQVIPAACAPYHANPVPWIDYWQEMLELIAAKGGCEGLAVHAYTRSSDPKDITSATMMGPPLQQTHSGFWTYMDALAAVPQPFATLPAFITEFNELLPDGWDNRNTGVVQAAYYDVNDWNADLEGALVNCLCLYRWPTYDKWHIEGKQGVIDDFQAAIGAGYTSPIMGTNAVSEQDTIHLPHIPNESTTTAPQLPPRDWDARLTQRGVTVETPDIAPGQRYWRVKSARWYDEQEADGLGPDHHIMLDALDIWGQRMLNLPVRVTWPSDSVDVHIEQKKGEQYGQGFGMSPSRNDYSVQVVDDTPSEIVRGIGMGMETPDGFNAGIHTSTGVVFERALAPQTQPTPTPAPPPIVAPGPQPPQEPGRVPALTHPIAKPALRVVSQEFGVNPDRYAKFGMAGHNGVDFAVPEQTTVFAVDDGEIVEAEMDADGYGRYLKLRHAWGESLYAHLSLYLRGRGARVKAGDDIALSGNTGNSTGPHLHFGMRVNPYQRGWPFDGYTDPMPYLEGKVQPTGHQAVIEAIYDAAVEFGVEPELLISLAWAESSFNPDAKSKAGALGLMQLMPATWDEWSKNVGGTNPFDADQNARLGAAYYAWLLRKLGNDWSALAAYNWGIGRVLDGHAPPDETVEFINKVLHGRDLLKAVDG